MSCILFVCSIYRWINQQGSEEIIVKQQKQQINQIPNQTKHNLCILFILKTQNITLFYTLVLTLQQLQRQGPRFESQTFMME